MKVSSAECQAGRTFLLRIASVVVALGILTGCQPGLRQDVVEGTVIDSTTKAPIGWAAIEINNPSIPGVHWRTMTNDRGCFRICFDSGEGWKGMGWRGVFVDGFNADTSKTSTITCKADGYQGSVISFSSFTNKLEPIELAKIRLSSRGEIRLVPAVPVHQPVVGSETPAKAEGK